MSAVLAAINVEGVTGTDIRAAVVARLDAHADAMEVLLALLDMLDGDPDLEPSLGAPEAKVNLPWGTVVMVRTQDGDSSAPADDVEAVNEDGDELASGELSDPIPGGAELEADA